MATLRRLSLYNPYHFHFRAPTPPPDSDFSDPEISTRDVPEIFRPVYNPPPPAPPPRSPQRASSAPTLKQSRAASRQRSRSRNDGGGGDGVVLLKNLFLVLAVLAVFWSWMGIQGLKRGVCLLLPGSGGMWDLCLDLDLEGAAAGDYDRAIGDDMVVQGEIVWESGSSRESTRPARRYKYERRDVSGQDFDVIVGNIVISVDDMTELARELVDGRVEMDSISVTLSEMTINDGFEAKHEHLKSTAQSSIQALNNHMLSIEEFADGIITYNSITLRELERLQKDSAESSLSWSDKIRGWFHGSREDIIERRTLEVLDLFTSKVGGTIEKITQTWKQQLEEVEHLKGAFGGIAAIFMGGKSTEQSSQSFGKTSHWEKALRACTQKQLDFESTAAALADLWNVIDNAGALMSDNLERLDALASSLKSLSLNFSTVFSDESDVAGLYAELLKSAGTKLEQARSDGQRTGMLVG